ncbi:MAG: SRPBCC family protein [Flavobacteriales bacterium]
MKRSIKRKLIVAIVLLVFGGLVGMISFSPYKSYDGFPYKLIKTTVVINAPADSVFRYLGNSENARNWSVFVHHIEPLNSDSVPDGQPGSKRRAYCNENEEGRRWDEITTLVEPNKRRQLTTFNYVDFWMTAEGLATEQLYVPLNDSTTQLSFTLFYLNVDPSWWEILKTHFASYTVDDIFERNMANIKRLVETGK